MGRQRGLARARERLAWERGLARAQHPRARGKEGGGGQERRGRHSLSQEVFSKIERLNTGAKEVRVYPHIWGLYKSLLRLLVLSDGSLKL